MAKGIEPGAKSLRAGCKQWRRQVRHLRRRGSVDYRKLDKSGENEPYASQVAPDTPAWVRPDTPNAYWTPMRVPSDTQSMLSGTPE